MARTLVSLTTVAGIAAGSLVGAGAGFAAPAQSTPAVASAEAGVLATVNLGLSTTQAANVQRALAARWLYSGGIDGQLGPESWKAMQRFLKANHGYTDPIDGIVGPDTIRALQRYLKQFYGYTGPIDGVAGAGTQAAFKRAAGYCPSACLLP
ncbi:peptidoglycan-binding protein [Streptomyces argenteolus]|uniref:Peptidoglycan-binding protein n=1 Tax=Streptomyces argenteolus TaxID=67274 RepID=A0ABW6WZS5_9ACTN